MSTLAKQEPLIIPKTKDAGRQTKDPDKDVRAGNREECTY